MIRLALTNALFNVLTLTIWRFWGKTRVRSALWGNTTAWGDPVEYTGTGRELFLGFLIVLAIIMLPLMGAVIVISALAETDPAMDLLVIPFYAVVAFLLAMGMYRAWRYQLSRTVWRGIRAGLDGSAMRYALIWTCVTLAVIVSLGWAWPWADMVLTRFRMNNTTFGGHRFQCDAEARPIYQHFALIWVVTAAMAAPIYLAVEWESSLGLAAALALSAVAIGLTYAGYVAARWREIAARTRFGDLRFDLDADLWTIARLGLGNAAITVLSLGLLRPWAALRTFRFVCARLTVDGTMDFAKIAQSNAARPRTGEGLMDALDGGGAF